MADRTYTLSFDREGTWELLRQVAAAVADVLGLDPAAWHQDSRTALSDANHTGEAFCAEWSRPGGSLSERACSGSGNPRDGYGYELTWRLELRLGARAVVARLADGSWNPWPKSLELRVEGIEPRELDRIRHVLRDLLGDDTDRCDSPYRARDNVRAALEVDPGRARRWLDAALAAGPPEQGSQPAWRELLLLDQELSGPSPELLRRRLVETPFDPGAWEEAAQDPKHGPLAQATLRRLRPVDPRSLTVPPTEPPGGWRRLEDGIGPRPGAWLPRMVNDVARALWPEATPCLEPGGDSVLEGSRTASSAVFARWSGVPLASPLQAYVMRTCRTYPEAWRRRGPIERYNAAPDHELMHAWLWGPTPDDCVQLRQEARRLERRLIHLGVLVGVTGSAAFHEEAEAALAEVTPFGWVDADPEDPFPDRDERPFPGLAAGVSRREAAEQLLVEVGAATPEVLAALRGCSCTKPARGYCEHATLLLTTQRQQRHGSARESSHRARCRSRARAKALDCAFGVLTRKPGEWGIDHSAREARKAWAQSHACRAD